MCTQLEQLITERKRLMNDWGYLGSQGMTEEEIERQATRLALEDLQEIENNKPKQNDTRN
jgi:cell division protein FtsL